MVSGRVTNKTTGVGEGGANLCSRCEGHGADFLRPNECLRLRAQVETAAVSPVPNFLILKAPDLLTSEDAAPFDHENCCFNSVTK